MQQDVIRSVGRSVGRSVAPKAVLVIDDDVALCRWAAQLLEPAGFEVHAAHTYDAGFAAAASARPYDLLILDWKLGDASGTDLARNLRADAVRTPMIFMSGHLTTPVTVDAMRLGAVDVLDKPVDNVQLLAAVRAAVTHAENEPDLLVRALAFRPRPNSATEHWVAMVLKALEAERDIATADHWAHHAGISRSRLRDLCALVGIPGKDALDFTRVLRAVVLTRRHACRIELLLEAGDPRTLERLLDRGGLALDLPPGAVSADLFLRGQKFIPADHEVLRVLRTALTR
jgi:DNA-binding response OmpR family regulator